MEVSIIPLTAITVPIYIAVGIRAYNQHYLHLWENQNSSPYINSSFTEEVLKKELSNQNNAHYLIYYNHIPIGIMKLIVNCAIKEFSNKEALLAEKIYILNEYSGKGIGRKTLVFIQSVAKQHNKKLIWLDTMKKGPAYFFYCKNGFKIIGMSQLKLPTAIESEREMYQMGYLITSLK